MLLEGIVSCVKHASILSENLYAITYTEGKALRVCQVKSGIVLHAGDKIKGEVVDGKIDSAIIEDPKEQLKTYNDLAEKTASLMILPFSKSQKPLMDKITLNMEKRLNHAASLMIKNILLGSPMIVRFHNDADGATGGYGLYLALQELFKKISPDFAPNISWKMQRGVAYTVNDAREDVLTIGSYNSISKPLLFITDFGTTEESLEGARIAKENFEIIWLDHHPVLNALAELVPNYINPWQFEGDSNYPAGFLTCEFGKRFANMDVSLIQSASLVGDYSGFASTDEEGRDLSLLLDMLTSDKKIAFSSGSNDLTPHEIDLILKDDTKKNDLIKYAKNRLEDALDSGIESIRNYKSDYSSIYLLDFENVRRDYNTKYPLPGRYASKLLERIEKSSDKPPILVLHFGHFVSIRVSTQIVDKVNLLALVNELKAGYSYIEAAGGHKGAASIKLRSDEMKKELVNALLRGLGCNIQ